MRIYGIGDASPVPMTPRPRFSRSSPRDSPAAASSAAARSTTCPVPHVPNRPPKILPINTAPKPSVHPSDFSICSQLSSRKKQLRRFSSSLSYPHCRRVQFRRTIILYSIYFSLASLCVPLRSIALWFRNLFSRSYRRSTGVGVESGRGFGLCWMKSKSARSVNHPAPVQVISRTSSALTRPYMPPRP